MGELNLISADSHVQEPPDLWFQNLPASLRDRAPRFAAHRVGVGFQAFAGGTDPVKRLETMDAERVSAEILYPTLGLGLFALEDVELQEACFRVYNDWLIDYCRIAPTRLIGLAAISAYRPRFAVEEMERCRSAGLRGIVLWQRPHPNLPFRAMHYESIWAAAQQMSLPVSFHIESGPTTRDWVGSPTVVGVTGEQFCHQRVNDRIHEVSNALFDLVFGGVCELYPKLKFVVAEAEAGWLPFYVQQWDYYHARARKLPGGPVIPRPPSEYVKNSIHCTFFRDEIGAAYLNEWGADTFLWASDYPHPNSTHGQSREMLARWLGDAPAELQQKLSWRNVAGLYGLSL